MYVHVGAKTRKFNKKTGVKSNSGSFHDVIYAAQLCSDSDLVVIYNIKYYVNISVS